jgi:hypothetical protein
VIKISLKGLAKFIPASPALGRSILRDYKFPKPEGAAQAKYYGQARSTIATFHAREQPHEWLEHQYLRLHKMVEDAPSHGAATRLRNNARAVQDYARTEWSRTKMDVLKDADLEFRHGNVRVTCSPDLIIRVDGSSKILKFDFAPKAPDNKVIAVMCQGLYEAARARGVVERTKDVIYLDVRRGEAHCRARVGSRVMRDIEAACENIEAIWASLQPRARATA